MKTLTKAVLLFAAAIALCVSCDAIRSIAPKNPKDFLKKTNDLGLQLCLLFGEENRDAIGLSPKEFCDDYTNLQPFIRSVVGTLKTERAGLLNAKSVQEE